MNFNLPPPQSTALPAGAPPFGVVFSGCPIRTDFAQVDANKYACRLQCPGDLPLPLASIAEIALFLLQPLPPDQGVLCYWQLTAAGGEQTGFELLGALTSSQPSQIFYTGWGEHEQMLSASATTTTTAPIVLTIGLSLEPVQNIDNVNTNNNATAQLRHQNRMQVAQKIASDLFNYLQSWDTGTAGPGNMVVPNNIFDRWFQRFENRLRRNPNFFLKDNDE
jgi:hypothetical protein